MRAKDTFNTAYYGPTDTRPWYTSTDSEPTAALTAYNIWHYYGGTPHPPAYAKPLDDSVALWRIPPEACYACNATVWFDTGNTFSYNLAIDKNDKPVPMAMTTLVTDSNAHDVGTTSNPIYRLADNESRPDGRLKSALAYDISYTNFCLRPQVVISDPGSSSAQNIELSSLISYLRSSSTKRVRLIRFDLYRGISVPRTAEQSFIPYEYESSDLQYRCVPMFDTLTYIPIPDNATTLKNFIKDGHSDWEDTKIYMPFTIKRNQPILFSNGEWTINTSAMHNIGLNMSFTSTNIKSGLVTFNSVVYSGITFKFTDDVKYFDDVTYKWKFVTWSTYLNRVLENGEPMPSSGSIRIYTELEVIDQKEYDLAEATYRAVLHEIAYFGLWFASTNSYALSRPLGYAAASSAGLFYPIKENGTTTGLYATGSDILNEPNAGENSTSDMIYTPDDAFTKYPDGSPALNNQSFKLETLNAYTGVNMESLLTDINSIPMYTGSDESTALYFFGSDPYDYILGYYLIPSMFIPNDFVSQYVTQTPEFIHIGKFITFNTKANPLSLHSPIAKQFTLPINIPRTFESFLDYEPYTKLELYLPYVGTVPLPTSIFIGHAITLYTSLDMLSGNVTYFIYADDWQVKTASGNARIELPVHGTDISSYSELIARNRKDLKDLDLQEIGIVTNAIASTGVSAGISAFKGNPYSLAASLIGGGLNAVTDVARVHLERDFTQTVLERSAPSPVTITNGSPNDGLANIQLPYITISTPRISSSYNKDTFAQHNGHACYFIDKLANRHGFSVIENPILDNLNISAEEKTMIRSLLAKGVILP